MLSISTIICLIIAIFAVFFFVEHLVLSHNYARAAAEVKARSGKNPHRQHAMDLNPDWKDLT